MDFNLDADALEKWVRESDGFEQLQEQANEHLRQIIREVGATHAGRPFAEVDAEIRRRFAEDGITPNEENLPKIVRAIVDRELTDEA
jgi:hypothetical protein